MTTPAVVTKMVQCKQCGVFALIGGDQDAHEAVDRAGCKCCPLKHHHGQAANACPGAGGIGHDGRPCTIDNDQCTVCRPLRQVMLAGSAPVTGV